MKGIEVTLFSVETRAHIYLTYVGATYRIFDLSTNKGRFPELNHG